MNSGLTERSDGEPAFTPVELRAVLGAFDLGAVHSVKPLQAAGSPTPKAVVVTDRGMLLLKRRRRGRDDPRRVAFTHEVQLRLIEHGFPAPRLLRTRDDQTMLTREGRVYELFEFVEGDRFDLSTHGAHEAGRLLGDFHRMLRPHGAARPGHERPQRTEDVQAALEGLSPSPLADAVRRDYQDALTALEDLGRTPAARLVVHGDWHPGNLRFRAGEVVAVIDYDSVGYGLRISDVAYGAIQFSLGEIGEAPGGSPPDEARLRAFAHGYHASMDLPLEEVETAAAPWLMIRSLVVEAAERRMAGAGVWRTVRTASDWIRSESASIPGFFIR